MWIFPIVFYYNIQIRYVDIFLALERLLRDIHSAVSGIVSDTGDQRLVPDGDRFCLERFDRRLDFVVRIGGSTGCGISVPGYPITLYFGS